MEALARPVNTTALAIALLVSAAACASHSALRDSLAQTATSAGPGATVAVTVLDLSTGVRSSMHGDLRLPMMSVFKLPLTVAALDAVDKGELSQIGRAHV